MIKLEEKKSKYNIWQNTAFMIRTAWRIRKSVLFICVALALITAGQTVAELLIVPVILNILELNVSLTELLTTIAIFSCILLIVSGLKTYIEINAPYGRIAVRLNMIEMFCDKLAGTAYPNIFESKFISFENIAMRALEDPWKPIDYIWSIWTTILAHLIGIGVLLLLLSGLNPGLIAIVVATTVIGYFVNRWINERDSQFAKEEYSYSGRMNYIHKIITERQYAKDIRIMGLGEWLDNIWFSTLKLYQAFMVKREKIHIWTCIVDVLLTLLRNGVAYAYLLWLIMNEGMSASEFVLYFSAISGFTHGMNSILENFSEFHKQSANISAIREFLEWPEPFKFEEGIPLAKNVMKEYEIRLEDVSFRYPDAEKETLAHINLTISPGEKLAVVGLSGAGKTTLVKLICGFLDPTEGRVLLNGVDIRKYNRRQYYALFSAVFQEFSVLEASVAENVAQCVDGIDEKRMWKCLEQAGLVEMVQSLPNGIQTRIGRELYEDGVELSGGQTQRLMLARALYKDGPILVLDEPTVALDAIAENDIYMKYNEMTDGKTSLFISHRLASTRFCDRILFLENGFITEIGNHDSLLAMGGGYAKLFEIQSQYYKEGGECRGE